MMTLGCSGLGFKFSKNQRPSFRMPLPMVRLICWLAMSPSQSESRSSSEEPSFCPGEGTEAERSASRPSGETVSASVVGSRVPFKSWRGQGDWSQKSKHVYTFKNVALWVLTDMGLLGISGMRGIKGSAPSSGSIASSCSDKEQFKAFNNLTKIHS